MSEKRFHKGNADLKIFNRIAKIETDLFGVDIDFFIRIKKNYKLTIK